MYEAMLVHEVHAALFFRFSTILYQYIQKHWYIEYSYLTILTRNDFCKTHVFFYGSIWLRSQTPTGLDEDPQGQRNRGRGRWGVRHSNVDSPPGVCIHVVRAVSREHAEPRNLAIDK